MGGMWHVKNWFRVGHDISWPLDFHTLFAFLFLSHPCPFFYHQAQKKHEFVLTYLKREMKDTIERYRTREEVLPLSSPPEQRTIWTIWWQGEENAPPLVKACIASMRRKANGAQVVVVTRDNYRDYVDIPDYIFDKKDKDYICFAVLSDIIRFHLLEKYGGLWLDSTIFVSKPIPPGYFQYTFYSQHTKPEEMTCWVQNNAYHIFVIGSQAHAKLVSFTKDMFLDYWKTHDTAVDYLCTDYFFYIAMQEYPEIRREIDALPWSSERLYDLVHLLDEPYDEQHFKALMSECIFSKLDWHRKYKLQAKGNPTYYSKLLDLGECTH